MTQQLWVAECLEWVGTPFRWQGRVKGDGADCFGLVVGAAKQLQYIPADWEFNRYARRDDLAQMAQTVVGTWFDDVTGSEMQPGDIVGFHKGHGIIHLGVLYEHPDGGFGIVHTEDYRQIVAHTLTAGVAASVAQVWRPRYEEWEAVKNS